MAGCPSQCRVNDAKGGQNECNQDHASGLSVRPYSELYSLEMKYIYKLLVQNVLMFCIILKTSVQQVIQILKFLWY